MIKLIWHTEQKKINELIPFEGNPRQMTEKQNEDLKKSLEKFNLVEIPAVDTDNIIVAGHQRLRIMQLLGRGKEIIDVRIPNRKLTDKEFREYNIRSNKNLGEWDYDLLANFNEEVLIDTGFEKGELDEIFGLETDEEFDIDEAMKKAVKNPKGIKKGDVWQLGEHRLVIGDCTKKENWEKLLVEERFDFMFTDPPYKLAYAKKKTKGLGTKKIRTKKGFGYKQQRSYLGVEERGSVPEYDEWLSIASEYQNTKGANIMIFEFWKNTPELWQAIEKYWKIKNLVIWHTPNRHQSFGMKYQFFNKYDIAPLSGDGELNEGYEKELEDYLQEKGQKLLDSYGILLSGQKGKSYWERKKGHKWARLTDHISWEVVSGKEGSIIFGAKPLQILVPYVKILSPRDGIVMEPFAGSGSTIIACEIMKRKCRAIEMSEIYSEVIIARWEKFTGRQAKKLIGR